MKIHPYIAAGIGSDPRITYSIRDGHAHTEVGWLRQRSSSSVPLAGASIEYQRSLFGLGSVKIIGTNASQEWSKLANVSAVHEALLQASQGKPPKGAAAETATINKGDPPADVVFGDRVALIPAISGFFDRPLWVQNPNPEYFADRPRAKWGAWINEGDKLICFAIRRNGHLGMGYRLAEGVFTNPILACIKSPVSGLVIDSGGAFLGSTWIDPKTGCYGNNFMLAVLLPSNAVVPETCEQAFAEFCDLCSRHRQSLFRNHHLVSEHGGHGGLAKVMEIWPEKKIDEVLTKVKYSPLIVHPASSLRSDPSSPTWIDHLEKLKTKHPFNFVKSRETQAESSGNGSRLHDLMERKFNPTHGSYGDRPRRSRIYKVWLDVESNSKGGDLFQALVMAIANAELAPGERANVLSELMQAMGSEN